MKLYHFPTSHASFKVRAVLFELGVPCEFITVNLMRGEHLSPAYLAKNPNGKVPVLEDEGLFLWESNAIVTYLAAKYPESGLMPADARGLATVQQWLQWHATQYMPSAQKVLAETFYAPMFGRSKNEQNWAQGIAELQRQLATLEKALEGREYITGRLSIADFSLVSLLNMRKLMGVDLSGFPHVHQWVERMEARESVRRSLPEL